MKISINNKLIEKIIRIIKLRKNQNDICKSNNNDSNNIREDKLNINDESLDKIYKLNRKENKKKSTEKEKIINFKKDKENGKIIDDIEFKKKRTRSGAIIECNVENVNDIIVYRRNGAKLKSETIPKKSQKRSKLSDEKNKLENKYTSKNVKKKINNEKIYHAVGWYDFS
ncbi:unknown [Clostridium sp. CAG:921]|nr:unknown [Clostridium sp. CAG:921]